MGKKNRMRDIDPQWSIERDRFVVLLHSYYLNQADPEAAMTAYQAMRDLGLSLHQAEDLLGALLKLSMLRHVDFSNGVQITPWGIHYLNHGCGRRRSVRLPVEESN